MAKDHQCSTDVKMDTDRVNRLGLMREEAPAVTGEQVKLGVAG